MSKPGRLRRAAALAEAIEDMPMGIAHSGPPMEAAIFPEEQRQRLLIAARSDPETFDSISTRGPQARSTMYPGIVAESLRTDELESDSDSGS